MSVIVRATSNKVYQKSERQAEEMDFEVFVKGAPEAMESICVSESSELFIAIFTTLVPKNYHELLNEYVHHGYRVLSLAWKKIQRSPIQKVLRMNRQDIESGCVFLGFIIFENKLKPKTKEVVAMLNRADIRQCMCTGDNALTAISVSRECGIVSPDSDVYVGKLAQQVGAEDKYVIRWENAEKPGSLLDPYLLKVIFSFVLQDSLYNIDHP